MIHTGRLQHRTGNYRMAASGAVSDRMLIDIASQFEAQIVRKIAAVLPEQIEKRYADATPVLAMTKYDGEGVYVYYEADKWLFAFNAPSGRVRVGLPVLERLDEHLKQRSIKKALFRCELYLPAELGHGKRGTISDVLRVSFGSDAEQIAKLRLAMLDVIMVDGKDLRDNQSQFKATWELLGDLFGEDENRSFHRPAGRILPGNMLRANFDEAVASGAEGLVVRRLERFEAVKIKPHLTIDAVVIGYVEGDFERAHGIASLLTALVYPERQEGKLLLHTFSRVGSGFRDEERASLLDTFSPLRVEAPLTMTDSDGRPVKFVKPIHIVELHGEDLVRMGSRDRENTTQLFALNEGELEFRGLAPVPRMTFATFNQMRQDKAVDTGGARIDQVLAAQTPARVESAVRKAPEIIRRDVYVKGEAVRKLLVADHGGNGSRLPYVVHWIDFSAKRKDPLKVQLEGAYTSERAHALAEKLLAENITKGFVRFGQGEVEAASAAGDTGEKSALQADRPAGQVASTKKTRGSGTKSGGKKKKTE